MMKGVKFSELFNIKIIFSIEKSTIIQTS